MKPDWFWVCIAFAAGFALAVAVGARAGDSVVPHVVSCAYHAP